jgi:hypothetical protein
MVDIVDVLAELGKVGLWLQAVGVIVILWIIFQIIAWKYNRKRMKEVYSMKEDVKRIESKIDRLLKKE